MSLAVKYRPKTFDEHIGQEHIVKALRKALKEGKISQAYLFAGPKGVGKTTTARILSKALNCESSSKITDNPCGICKSCIDIENSRHVDVIEIDGASNRGIDEVRNIRENIKNLPIRGRYKVYIVDEVHMLTIEAFNALLKTLEEPPKHVVFIFATTDPQKIPPTVLSRLQRYDFRPIPIFEIIQRLNYIVKKENIDIEDRAIEEIARRSDSSLRDAISILEQMTMFIDGKITHKDVINILGSVESELMEDLLSSILSGNVNRAIDITNEILQKNLSILDFIREFNTFLFEKFKEIINNPSKDYTKEDLMQLLNTALEMEKVVKYSITPKIWLVFFISKMCYIPRTVQLLQILQDYNLVYRKTKREEEKKKETIKDKLYNHVINHKKSQIDIFLTAQIEEEKESIIFTFSDANSYSEAKLKLDEIRKELSALGYNYKNVEIKLKEENPKKVKLINELSLRRIS
ncbi:MAG: DNA polymerase III subunit gamma/tau [candidate division WOR-3 bacterium]|nr:DNA polymerase III subunit gamma/tau [candidate division WOR-3 bacterium]MCX7947284.1 DNA polymerase III subunit gamma/tau [candidate division WOR-3 bacterium]MDW8150159.1 DNA polymerase III subunit gamma/tau [candidate division WOR-3 bacterium]